MREIVAESLRKDGHEVVEVADGGELLARLARGYANRIPPDDLLDLILTDIRMPVCSGLDAVQALRAGRWETPVIIMTAFGDAETRERARGLGATLLDKPFRISELRALVKKVLDAGRG